MRRSLLLTTLLLTNLNAYAQTAPVPLDVQQLRRAHQADEDDRYAIKERPRPPQGRPQTLYDTRYPFICMGTDPFQPVYAKPDYASRIPNWLTNSAVAITGNPINGFITVLYYNGHTVYIPASAIHPYHGVNNPDATCIFKGEDARGRPMFQYDVPHPVQ